MAQTIKLKRSATSGAVPTTSALALGEMAINTHDGNVYIKKDDGAESVVEVGTNPSAEIVANGGIALPDNGKATFGASDDLQIYHDGFNTLIKESGAGSLLIDATNTYFRNAAGTKDYAWMVDGGAVSLFHNNASKLATTATGIDVTGTATMDGLTVDASSAELQKNTGATFVIGTKDTAGSSSSPIYTDLKFEGWNNKTNSLLRSWDEASSTGFGRLEVHTNDSASLKRRALFDYNGDISFYEDTGTTPKLFWDASAESLGIGTSSPGAKLSINGSASINGFDVGAIIGVGATNASSPYFVLGDQQGVALRGIHTGTFGRKALAFYTSNNTDSGNFDPEERMRLDSAGNVGIGTTTPQGKLSVSNNGAEGIEFFPANQSGLNTTQHYNRSGTAYVINKIIASEHRFNIGGNERARLDTSGNLLVGKTATGTGTVGAELRANGFNAFVRSGGEVMNINRLSSDGTIVDFRKDSSTVGSIGTNSGYVRIGTGDTNLLMHSVIDTIVPHSGSANRDAAINLGYSGARFKDLYLSGDVRAGGRVYIEGSTTNFLAQGPYGSTNLGINFGNAVFFYSGATQIAFLSPNSAQFNNQIIADKTAATTGTASATIISKGTVDTVGGYNPQNFHITFQDGGGTTRGSISSSHYATIYSTSSDYRLKEDLQPISNATERLLALNPVNFKWIDGQERSDGFIAHELQEHLPEAVTGEKDATAEFTETVIADDGTETEVTTTVPDMQGIDQSKLVPLLVKTIQELEARITALENA